jgi:hypothetical protein
MDKINENIVGNLGVGGVLQNLKPVSGENVGVEISIPKNFFPVAKLDNLSQTTEALTENQQPSLVAHLAGLNSKLLFNSPHADGDDSQLRHTTPQSELQLGPSIASTSGGINIDVNFVDNSSGGKGIPDMTSDDTVDGKAFSEREKDDDDVISKVVKKGQVVKSIVKKRGRATRARGRKPGVRAGAQEAGLEALVSVTRDGELTSGQEGDLHGGLDGDREDGHTDLQDDDQSGSQIDDKDFNGANGKGSASFGAHDNGRGSSGDHGDGSGASGAHGDGSGAAGAHSDGSGASGAHGDGREETHTGEGGDGKTVGGGHRHQPDVRQAQWILDQEKRRQELDRSISPRYSSPEVEVEEEGAEKQQELNSIGYSHPSLGTKEESATEGEGRTTAESGSPSAGVGSLPSALQIVV